MPIPHKSNLVRQVEIDFGRHCNVRRRRCAGCARKPPSAECKRLFYRSAIKSSLMNSDSHTPSNCGGACERTAIDCFDVAASDANGFRQQQCSDNAAQLRKQMRRAGRRGRFPVPDLLFGSCLYFCFRRLPSASSRRRSLERQRFRNEIELHDKFCLRISPVCAENSKTASLREARTMELGFSR
jgi:hypothetical protein